MSSTLGGVLVTADSDSPLFDVTSDSVFETVRHSSQNLIDWIVVFLTRTSGSAKSGIGISHTIRLKATCVNKTTGRFVCCAVT